MITDLKINPKEKERYYKLNYWGTDTLCDVWNVQAARYAARTYVKDDLGGVLTYGEVDRLSSRLAAWLKYEAHVENGDVVTFQVPKWVEFCIIYVACLKVGAVMHPIATNFNIEDLRYAFGLVKPRAYICPTFYKGVDFEKRFDSIEDNLKQGLSVLLIDKIDAPRSDSKLPSLSDVLSRCQSIEEKAPSSSDDVACILMTSGTTGKPKAALLTHNNILFSERSYVSVLDLTPDDVAWMPSPLNHATGFFHGLIATMLVGSSTVLELCFSADDALRLIKQEGCTWSHGATPFVHDIVAYMEKTGDRAPSLRFYLCGGAPIPGSMVKRAHKLGFLLCESYGSTESCPHVYVPLDKCIEWNGAWSGIAYDGIEICVVDNDRRPVPFGVQGEECSRGPHQFVGYLNDKERTDKALDDDGWFYSGDLCVMDEEGRIRITGRKKEILIRGGENISSNEVDEGVAGCPGIGDHATIGMPDDRLGERICTFAVPEGENRPGIPDIQRYLKEKGVPKRLWPERIEYIDEIPYTKTGKVKRFKLSLELEARLKAEREMSKTSGDE